MKEKPFRNYTTPSHLGAELVIPEGAAPALQAVAAADPHGVHAHDAHAHGAHGHPAHVAHHFDTMEQQHSAAKLGMWLFLVTEVLLFGGLFVAYAIFRHMFPEAFHTASHLLNWRLGTLNTAVLIGSSLTMALAVHAAQTNQKRRLIVYLTITLACAAAFLVVKYFEYTHKFHLGIYPGKFFNPHGAEVGVVVAKERVFFSIYYLMTGLHGVHVLFGMGAIGWILNRSLKREFSSEYYTPVELTGLYWHLVDLIWIYLFPLLYLIR